MTSVGPEIPEPRPLGTFAERVGRLYQGLRDRLAALVPRRRLPAPWNRLTGLDWIFVLFAWITLYYFAYNTLETVRDGASFDFDFMPLTAGVLIVPFGWWAVRLRARALEAIEGLDNGAALSLRDETVLPRFLANLARTVRFGQWAVGIGVLVCIVVGLIVVLPRLYGASTAGTTDPKSAQSGPTLDVPWVEAGLLVAVMLLVAIVIGSILGSLVGYGWLPRVMRRHGISLAGLSTREARDAWRILERLFGFSMMATTALCLWLAAWLLLWSLGIDVYGYSAWFETFAVLWLIGCILFVMAGLLPARAFQRRLDELHGGAAARRALDRQIAQASRDRIEILAEIEAGKWRLRRDLVELDRFLRARQEHQFRSPLLRPAIVYSALTCNVATGVTAIAIRFLATVPASSAAALAG